MVFGWGNKKPVEPTRVERTSANQNISLSDVPQIISDLSKLRESQTLSEIKNLRNNTAPLIDDLMKIGIVLEKDDLKIDDIDKHLAIIVVRGKQQVIDILKKDVKNLMQVSTLDDAKKLDYFLNQLLKKVGDVLGRQTRVIHIFAKKYANRLRSCGREAALLWCAWPRSRWAGHIRRQAKRDPGCWRSTFGVSWIC